MSKFFKKVIKFILFILVTILIANILLERFLSPVEVNFGVTYSPRFARYLKLDWKETYIRMLDELKVRELRLTSYWDSLQPDPQKYDFSETDYLLEEANKRQARVILVIGARQPRWPECHVPSWAKNLSVLERQRKILEFVQETVKRYKDYPSIWAWQVENEPFLSSFGEGCDKADANFLKAEIDLVRAVSNKKIIISDSGELGAWVVPMQLSDIFGTTLYRQVYDKSLGYITYPLPPYFYSLKSSLIKKIFAPYNQKTIIVELQGEPWLAGGDFVLAEQQAKLFTAENLKNYINYVQRTGFSEAYLWGVEWWYFMEKAGHSEYLDFVGTIFR